MVSLSSPVVACLMRSDSGERREVRELVSEVASFRSDFAIRNCIFRFIKDKTNLRLQSERSTSALGSFRLVSQPGFRFLFHLTKLLFDRKNVLVYH